jgi:hypothetical protein
LPQKAQAAQKGIHRVMTDEDAKRLATGIRHGMLVNFGAPSIQFKKLVL